MLSLKRLPEILDRLEQDIHVVAYNLGVEVERLTAQQATDQAELATLRAEVARLRLRLIKLELKPAEPSQAVAATVKRRRPPGS